MEEMKRRDKYERSQAAKRIQEETERSRQLLEQRKQLQVGGCRRGSRGWEGSVLWMSGKAAAACQIQHPVSAGCS